MKKKIFITSVLIVASLLLVFFFTRICTISGSVFRMKTCECTGFEVTMQKPTVPGSEFVTRCFGFSKKTNGYTGKDLEFDGRLRMKTN